MVAPPKAAELQLAQRALASLLVRLPAGNRGNTLIYTVLKYVSLVREGTLVSGKTLHCRPRDCELTKITKSRYVLVLSRRNAPVYQCYTLGTLQNLVCHIMWRAFQNPASWATTTKLTICLPRCRNWYVNIHV